MRLQRLTSSIAMVTALTLGASAVAQAQPHGGPRHHGPQAHAQGPQHGPHSGWQHGPRPRPQPHGYYGHRPPPPAVHHYRGAGPRHNWVRGSYLPPQYRAPRYVVHNWRGHRLHQPPRGYHWVQYGGDYMLVAIASGVITQLIINGVR